MTSRSTGMPAPTPSREAGREAWRAGVAGVLAKARRVERAELGPEPERLLDTETYDGLTIAALYTVDDELPEAPLPGVAPFTRGADAHRDPTVGWHVRTRYGSGEPVEVNRRILADLENGVTSVWLTLGVNALPVDTLDTLLTDVFVDLAPVVLDAGAETAAAAAAFHALVDDRGLDPAEVTVSLGADPLTSLVRTGDARLAEAVQLASTLVERGGPSRAIALDARVFHDAGAADAYELGAAVAAGIDVVRALVAAGIDLAEALTQIEFRFAATDDQFATIAKFRAGRRLWARVAEALGAPEAGAAPQHAVTSSAMISQRDPWVNMLRSTVAAFGAGIGGADAVTVLPFDDALPGGAPGVSRGFAARIARNTQLLLLEEAHLGRVLDPAAGSWHVESLTDALAAKAWTHLQALESAGGALTAIGNGLVAEDIAVTRAWREDDIAHRRTAVTGVSQFPNLADPPPAAGAAAADTGALPVHRYAESFERLRDRSDAHLQRTGERPTAFLATLGPLAEHAPRTGFVATLLASGGVAATEPGPLDDPAAVTAAYRGAPSPVAVVCGAEKRYAASAAEAITALREAGATRVLLAGAKLAGDIQPDGFLGVGTDAVTALTDLLDTMGVS